MANWVKTFLEENPDVAALPVTKRARHAIHFALPGGGTQAYFTGSPCHYLDTDGLYKPLDTKLVAASGGFYGAPGLDVKIHTDGRVTVDGSNYYQYTELPGAPTGYVDGDRIVRPFANGEQRLRLIETGFKNEIILNSLPSVTNRAKLLASISGTMPAKYIQFPTRAIDSAGNVYVHTTLTAFRNWLATAVFPVIIDPDFADSTADGYIYGWDSTYAGARASADTLDNTSDAVYVGQTKGMNYFCYRAFLKFDTSSIPDTDTVTQVNMKLTVNSDYTATDYDVQIVKYNWSSVDPLTSGNMETAYDGCLAASLDDNIWRNTSGISANTTYTSGNLATAWVSKTGSTYYGLMSKLDRDNTAPTQGEQLLLWSQEAATSGYRPVLVVTHSALNQYTLTCGKGTFTLTGIAATLKKTKKMTAEVGTYSLSGKATTFKKALKLAAGTGAYVLTGKDATFIFTPTGAYVLSCGPGSFALTGQAAAFRKALKLPAAAGAYVLTGQAATLKAAKKISMAQGSYILTGLAAALSKTKRMSMGVGSYTLTGLAAALSKTKRMSAGVGSYALTGQAASFKKALKIGLASGSYSLTGQDAGLYKALLLNAAKGTYTYTGYAAILHKLFVLLATKGTYILTGRPAIFTAPVVVTPLFIYILEDEE